MLQNGVSLYQRVSCFRLAVHSKRLGLPFDVAVAALGNNRATWNTAISGLGTSGWTNIGDGLQKAKDMIVAAGGVTANTYIVLMTDGLNNRPSPQASADADLQAKINDLLASGIPLFPQFCAWYP